MLPRTTIFHVRRRSLARAIALSVCAFLLSLHLGGFPDINALHLSHWQLIPVVLTGWSIGETIRCADRTWSLHYAGVLILLYSELMIMCLAVFLFFYP